MALEIRDPLKKYLELNEDRTLVRRFVCPVEGCNYSTTLGPGALRMHLLIKADPASTARYCEAHEAFCNAHREELGSETVRYLYQLPRVVPD
ncbi:MAG TPA: hypothetical protein VM050_09250 [Patescibacteria group bacterium]|nr:hypothetical protein [Patescibacteria group bacterium]